MALSPITALTNTCNPAAQRDFIPSVTAQFPYCHPFYISEIFRHTQGNTSAVRARYSYKSNLQEVRLAINELDKSTSNLKKGRQNQSRGQKKE